MAFFGTILSRYVPKARAAGTITAAVGCCTTALLSTQYFLNNINQLTAVQCDKARLDSYATKASVLRKRMTSIGYFSLLSETESNPSIISFFMVLSGKPLSSKEFIKLWNDREMGERHPRFHQVVSETHKGYFETTPYENKEDRIGHHVSETILPLSRADLLSRMQYLQSEAWNLSDKLWHIWIASNASNATVLLFRGHHLLADGASMTAAFMDLSDEAEDFRKAIYKIIQQRKRIVASFWKRLFRKLQKLVYFVLGSLRAITYQLHLYVSSWWYPSPWTQLRAESTNGRRVLSYSTGPSVEQVKWVARQLGSPSTTINDVFCSCIAGAMDRLFQYHAQRATVLDDKTKIEYPKFMNMALPVHLQGGVVLPGESIGNKLGALSVRVPVYASSPVERLQTMHRELSTVKETPMALLSHLLARSLSTMSTFLPSRWVGWIFEHAHGGASCVVTNSRGPNDHIHLSGRKVENLFGFIPLPPGIPVGVVVSSYAGEMKLTMTAESWAVPDGDLFLSWILEDYVQLLNAAKEKTDHNTSE